MKKTIYILSILLISMLSVQCSSDDDTAPAALVQQKDENPIEKVYQEVAPKAFIDIIVNSCTGTQVYTGTNPPSGLINKTMLSESYRICSTVDGEDPGARYQNALFTIKDYDPVTSKCTLEYFQPAGYVKSDVAYLLGDGSEFALFARGIDTNGDVSAKFLYWFTGTYTPDGIKGLRHYLQSVEVPEEGKDKFLEEGKFRGFVHNFEDNANSVTPFVPFGPPAAAVSGVWDLHSTYHRILQTDTAVN